MSPQRSRAEQSRAEQSRAEQRREEKRREEKRREEKRKAALGSLLRRSSNVLVVNILAPAGWMMVFVGNCAVAMVDGAEDFSRVTFAAESTSAVVSRFAGLVQPDAK